MSEWYPIIVRLDKIINVPNSDFLETSIIMNEYPVVFRKGEFKEGQLVSFLPYDTVCPDNEIFYFLAPPPKKDILGTIIKPSPPIGEVPIKNRTIRSRKIRNYYSEGLILAAPEGFKEGDSVVEHFGLTKRVYEEELPELPGKGSNENEKSPKTFSLSKYDLESMAKYSSCFEDGERVIITEKIEGENCCITYAENKLWVKSRNYYKRNGYSKRKPRTIFEKVKYTFSTVWESFLDWGFGSSNEPQVAMSHWWEVPIRMNLQEKLKMYPRMAIYGELYGAVRGWNYDCKIIDGKIQREFRVFDIYDLDRKRFLEWSMVEAISSALGLNTVPVLYDGFWKTDRSLYDLAEGKSTIGDCVKEGWVMRSMPEGWHPKLGRKIIKLKGRDYKLAKG